MLSEFEELLLKQYGDRMLKSGLNTYCSSDISREDFLKHCIKQELKYQLTQMMQNYCQHSYPEPKYNYSQFGNSCIFTCVKCSHQLEI